MDATFWALVGLVIFLGLIIYLKVPAMVTKSLDDRSEGIRDELEEARKLREEAQSLLADYETKRREAEKDGADALRVSAGALEDQRASLHPSCGFPTTITPSNRRAASSALSSGSGRLTLYR